MKFTRFKEDLRQRLHDPAYAAVFLQSACDDSLEEFLYALREVVAAHGGMTSIAEKTGRGRSSLYKSLSRGGAPSFHTVVDVLHAVGLSLSVRGPAPAETAPPEDSAEERTLATA